MNELFCVRTPEDYVSRMSQYGGGTTERRKQTYLAPLNPDDNTNENDDKVILSLIGRYKRRAKKTTKNVCEGMFP
jgi:hypothetical protein